VLFGDGAGAVLIKAADNMYRQINYTRGDTDVLVCRGIGAQDAYVKMNGNAVFRFAVDVLKQGIDEILKKSDMTLDDIDYIVCHQANERIINHVKKKYPGHEDKFYINIAEYGNTSAASIPIALDELAQRGCFDKGRKLILAGFGAGLSWSSALIET
jgi:3-oxoacyl-[acyl-carrier-protein] synthase 3